ncbi:MAG: hypothetical protein ACK5IB_10515 [Qingshengfaniella sp.]
MRDLIIGSFEKLVGLIVVVMLLAVVLGAVAMMFGSNGGFLPGLGFLVFGVVNIVLGAGIAYLVLGIHDNTRRTAEAMEKLADRP